MASPQNARPLSPHVGIYRWQITNTLSILHRLTGVALSVGTLFLVAWLWAAAYNGEYFLMWRDFFSSFIGQLMLFGWSAAFYYHLGNGIRHLLWDTGWGFELGCVKRTGIVSVTISTLLTLGTWGYILSQGGY